MKRFPVLKTLGLATAVWGMVSLPGCSGKGAGPEPIRAEQGEKKSAAGGAGARAAAGDGGTSTGAAAERKVPAETGETSGTGALASGDEGSTEPQLVLFGRVTLPDGSAGAGTTVTLGKPQMSETGFSGFVAGEFSEVLAGEDGRFRVSRTGVEDESFLMGRAERAGSATVYFPVQGGITKGGRRPGSVQPGAPVKEIERNVRLEAAAFLRGKVVDESARPLTSATVVAVPVSGGRSEETGASFGAQFTTGPDGTFALDELTSGEYTLMASAQGWIGASRKVSAPAGDVMLSLTRGQASISGNVYSFARREAMAGTSVTLQLVEQEGVSRRFEPPKQVMTDEVGGFQFEGLGPGKYLLRAAKGTEWRPVPDETPGRDSLYAVSVGATESTSGLALYLYQGHTVTGLVRDSKTSQPLEGVTVAVNGGEKKTGTTDAEGRFRIPHVFAEWGPGGQLEVRKKGYRIAPLRDGRSYTDSRVRVTLSMKNLEPYQMVDMAPTVTVSGTVRTENGTPVAGASVGVFVAGDWSSREKKTESDSKGQYELEVKPWSVLRVKAEAEGYGLSYSPAETEVEDEPVKGVDVVLKPGITVSGRVVDYEGKPVEGASVYANTSVRVGRYGTGDQIGGGQKQSGPEGRFTFTNVPASEVYFSAQKKGYARSSSEKRDFSGSEAPGDVTLTLKKAHFIAGRVTDADGKPVPNVYIQMMRVVGNSYYGGESPRTDAEGRYRAEDLEEGTYRLEVSDSRGNETKNGVKVDQENVDFVLGAKKSTETANARKKEGTFTFVGRVVDWQSGQPIRDFTVAGRNNITAEKDPNEPGRFTVANVSREQVLAFFIESPGYLLLETERFAGTATERTFKLGPGGSVIGRLVEGAEKKPVANVRVQLKGKISEYELDERAPEQMVRTDGDGRFRLEKVTPGQNWLVFRPEAPLVNARRQAAVEHGKETDLGEVALSGGARVTGRVVRTPGDTPVAGTMVRANEQMSGRTGKEAKTGADGAFEFSGLSPVGYNVSVPEFNLNSSFALTDGQTKELVLRVGGSTVKGRFLRGGQAVQGSVSLTQPDGARKSTMTDSEGAFDFKGVTAGRWQLSGSAYNNDGVSGRVEEQVEVTEGAEVTKDLVLPSGRLVGRVEDKDGEPVAGAQISARAPQGTSADDSYLPETMRARSGADGTFVLEGMKPGVYGVTANSAGRIAMANSVSVPAEGDSVPVVLKLGAGGGTIVSTALNMTNGAPIKEAWLLLSSASGRFDHGQTRGEDGTLTVENVPPGRYQVQVSSFGFQVSEKEIEVKEGETTRIDDVLYEAGALRWRLQDKDGGALKNARCQLVPDDANSIEQPRQGTVTSADGVWVVRGLYPGSYTGTATATDGRVVTAKITIQAHQLAEVTTQAP